MRELENCHQNHLFPVRECASYQEDFFECHSRNKQVLISITQDKTNE